MISLPWTMESGPHLVLEVNDSCNISCRGCYKQKTGTWRGAERILDDLAAARRLRRVQTVSLAGAEPTLHPDLPALVTHIHRLGLRTSLVTNGLLLTDELLAALHQAGLDVVMLHIDEGQKRPDLSALAPATEVNALRRSLARRVAGHGIDAGLSVTLYRHTLDRLPDLVRLILESPEISFAFLTQFVDVVDVLRGDHNDPGRTTNEEVIALMRRAFALEPFAGVGPSASWVSYFVPVTKQNGSTDIVRLRPGRVDALLLRLPQLVTGRHLFYCPPRPATARAQVMVNLLARGQLRRAWRLRGARLAAKRLVFDNGLQAPAKGQPDCSEFCPNPTVRHGRLVPVCMADHRGAA